MMRIQYIMSWMVQSLMLARFKQEHSYLSKIKVDEMLCFMGNIGSKVTTHNYMPSRIVLFIELLLDIGRDVLSYDKKFMNKRIYFSIFV